MPPPLPPRPPLAPSRRWRAATASNSGPALPLQQQQSDMVGKARGCWVDVSTEKIGHGLLLWRRLWLSSARCSAPASRPRLVRDAVAIFSMASMWKFSPSSET